MKIFGMDIGAAVGNKNETQNDYDQSQTWDIDNRQDNRDMSTNSTAIDNSSSVVNQSSFESDFGAIKEAFAFATTAVDGMNGNSDKVLAFAGDAADSAFSFGTTVFTDSMEFGASALDAQSDTAKEAFQLVEDSQDSAYAFSSGSQNTAFGLTSDALTKTLDAMGGVLNMNKAVNSEALQTVSNLSTNIATGGAVTTGTNMQKAMITVAVVATIAVLAVVISAGMKKK